MQKFMVTELPKSILVLIEKGRENGESMKNKV